MKKKLIGLVLSMAMVGGLLAGCGSSTSELRQERQGLRQKQKLPLQRLLKHPRSRSA